MKNTSIEKWQTKLIYARAAQLGLVDKSEIEDELHALVYKVTNKSHITDLSYLEAKSVIDELSKYSKPSKDKKRTGMASEGQIKKIWRLMYLLKEYDQRQSEIALLNRLRGFLKKYAGVDDLKFLSYKKANSVIEGLKNVIDKLESKKQKIWELENKAGAIFEEMLNTADLGKWVDLKEEYDLIKRQIDVMQILRSDEIDQAAGANSKT